MTLCMFNVHDTAYNTQVYESGCVCVCVSECVWHPLRPIYPLFIPLHIFRILLTTYFPSFLTFSPPSSPSLMPRSSFLLHRLICPPLQTSFPPLP